MSAPASEQSAETVASPYMDFCIETRCEGGNRYFARVYSTPPSTPLEERFEFPLQFPPEVQEAMAEIDVEGSVIDIVPRRALKQSASIAPRLGQALFTALMENTTCAWLYRRVQEVANERDQGLRWRVIAQDERAANLPWEFLFTANLSLSSYQPDFLALSARTPLVRQWGQGWPMPVGGPAETAVALARRRCGTWHI